jgi:hypothetical protein
MECTQDESGTGHPDWVAQGNSAPVDIQFVHGDSYLVANGHCHHGKRFVHFKQVYVRNRQASMSE